MRGKKRIGAIAAAAACLLAGGAIGIDQSTAASSHSSTSTTTSAVSPTPKGGGHFGQGVGGAKGSAVHSVSEVLNQAGTAYIAQTSDSGTITAIDTTGDTITLKEGTSTVTYASPTIAVPTSASVSLDGSSSSLSALAAGDHVTITSSSDGTSVSATDASGSAHSGSGKIPGGKGQAPQGLPSGSNPGLPSSGANAG